ncbi:MAG: hypothetical protein ACTHPD_06950 [Rhizomicrobium sp.]
MQRHLEPIAVNGLSSRGVAGPRVRDHLPALIHRDGGLSEIGEFRRHTEQQDALVMSIDGMTIG